jgi:type IV pilus assembly protein PilW
MAKQHPEQRKSRQAGIGLLEVLIAIVLSLFLVGGVAQLFVGSKQSYRTTEELSRLQENARYAIYLLQRDIRMAGYSGCAPAVTSMLNPAGSNYDDTLYNLDEPVGGWNYTGTDIGDTVDLNTLGLDPSGVAVSSWDDQDGSSLLATLQNKVLPGTDTFAVKFLNNSSNIAVKPPNKANAAQISTETATGIPQYSILLVTKDCVYADLFQKRNVTNATSVSRGNGASTNPGPGNISGSWSTSYDADTSFLFFVSRVYFVGQGSGGEPALFVADYSLGTATVTIEEMVEGVENMQILFGEDTDNDGIANQYVSIDSVGNANNIASVKVSLLMRTLDNIGPEGDDSNRYLFGTDADDGTAIIINTVDTDDRRLRYVFNSTIKLRNRGDI